MVDTTLIAAHYARMSDAELIALAQNEGQDLTEASRDILYTEFTHRGLDTTVFEEIHHAETQQQDRNRHVAKVIASVEFVESLWKMMMDKKEAGETDGAIYQALMQKGLGEDEAIQMLQTMESKATQMLNACDTEAISGGVICGIGLAITLWTLSSLNVGSFVVVAWGAIIFGAIRCLRALSKKGYYKRILENIRQEHKGMVEDNA